MIRFITNILEPLSYLIFSGFFFIYIKNENSKKIWAFLGYYVVSTFLMLIATQKVFSDTNNITVYNLHLLTTSLIYCFYFYHLLDIKSKKIFYFIVALSIGYYFIKNILLKDTGVFDSFGFSMVSAFIILCLFFYFRQELKRFDGKEIFLSFDFWYSSSLLLYHLGGFIIFLVLFSYP